MALDSRELDVTFGAAADAGVYKGYQLNEEHPETLEETQLMRCSPTAKH